jgi:hypothetical protein
VECNGKPPLKVSPDLSQARPESAPVTIPTPKFEPQLGLSRDPDHHYFWRDLLGTTSSLPSVTKVCDLVSKPGLVPAASRLIATYATTHLEDVARLVQAVGIEEATKKLSGMPRDDWARKGELGSQVHTLAELVLRGKEVSPTPQEAPYLEGLTNFIADAHPIPLALEEMVAFEDEVGIAYAGTFDAVLQLASGRWLVDFKTGKDIYQETALQLAGYGFASFIGRPGTTQRYEVPQVDAFAVIHLHPSHPRGYAFVPYEVGRVEWLAFMALLDVWEWIHTKRPKRERMQL